jgi:hypothetical protein
MFNIDKHKINSLTEQKIARVTLNKKRNNENEEIY